MELGARVRFLSLILGGVKGSGITVIVFVQTFGAQYPYHVDPLGVINKLIDNDNSFFSIGRNFYQ